MFIYTLIYFSTYCTLSIYLSVFGLQDLQNRDSPLYCLQNVTTIMKLLKQNILKRNSPYFKDGMTFCQQTNNSIDFGSSLDTNKRCLEIIQRNIFVRNFNLS